MNEAIRRAVIDLVIAIDRGSYDSRCSMTDLALTALDKVETLQNECSKAGTNVSCAVQDLLGDDLQNDPESVLAGEHADDGATVISR